MGDQVREDIGRLLRAVRQERGLGLQDVESLTGQLGWPVSRSRLSNVERGETDIRLSDLYALSRAYGIPVTDLIAESIVAHGGRKKFPEELSAEDLFAEGKKSFRHGFPLEAGWAFEEAARRAGDDTDQREFVFLCRVSAGHCYEHAGAVELAIKRVEDVLDQCEENSGVFLRALAKAAVIRARYGSGGRARLYLTHLNGALERKLPADLKAVLLGAKSVVVFYLGSQAEAANLALESARSFAKCGDFAQSARLRADAALYLLAAGRTGRSLRVAKDACGQARGLDDVESAIMTELALAEALLAAGQFSEARPSAESAGRLARRHGYDVNEAWAYEILSDIETSEGRDAIARRWKQKRRSLAVTGRTMRFYCPLRGRR